MHSLQQKEIKLNIVLFKQRKIYKYDVPYSKGSVV